MSQSYITSRFAKKLKKFRRIRRMLEARETINPKDHVAIRHYNALVARFRKLQKQLAELHTQLKFAAAGTAFVAMVASAGNVAAQTTHIGVFKDTTRAFSPIRTAIIGKEFSPNAADYDHDGDYDIVLGDAYGRLKLLKNEGTASVPKFTPYPLLISGTDDPISVPHYAAPAFADIDRDGDEDLFVGGSGSDLIYYFINDGNNKFTDHTDDPWDPVTRTGNPFYDLNISYVGTRPKPYFIDFDSDGDLDVFIGHEDYNDNSLDYYRFEAGEFIAENNFYTGATNSSPAFGDLNDDGDPDMVVGTNVGIVFFLNSSGNLSQQNGPWTWDADPETPGQQSEGNPFEEIAPGDYNSPLLVDLDHDGDLDAVVGTQTFSPYSGEYLDTEILYYVNDGKANFTLKEGIESPFGGLAPQVAGSVILMDVNHDSYLDVIAGPAGESIDPDTEDYVYTLKYYQGTADGSFTKVDGSLNPFHSENYQFENMENFTLVDLDGDGDLDIIGGALYTRVIYYFKNEGSDYVLQPQDNSNPFYPGGNSLVSDYYSFPQLIDIDADSDLDLFIGNKYGTVSYYENVRIDNSGEQTGTDTFIERAYADNPLSVVDYEDYYGYQSKISVRFKDLDNDGDADAFVGTSQHFINDDGDESQSGILYYENTGTKTNPQFQFNLVNNPFGGLFTPGSPTIGDNPAVSFGDVDRDGDLDAFIPDETSSLLFYVNANPAPVVTVGAALNYTPDSGPVTVDATLTLTDADNDLIVRATITIVNYENGKDVLSFTAASGITGSFNATSGVLTLTGTGKNSVAEFQSVLRSVKYKYSTIPGGRESTPDGRIQDIVKGLSFMAVDTDGTLRVGTVKNITVTGATSTANRAPVITSTTVSTQVSQTVNVNLAAIVSDPDNNIDISTLKIITAPISGAKATIQGGQLTVNYSNTKFAGTDKLRIEVCDAAGVCTQQDITILVDGEIMVYNGISPNGDGRNDYFHILNIETLYPENHVSIYNRWGDVVYETDNYDNSSKRFEGNSNSGKELTSGVYFYKIVFSSGREPLSGYLTIKR